MTKFYRLSFLILLSVFFHQHVSAQIELVQGFELDGDTWNKTVAPAPYNVPGEDDIWSDTTTAEGFDPTERSRFWFMRDLDNPSGGFDGFHTIDLEAVGTTDFLFYTITFDYFTVGYEASDSIGYILETDNGTEWDMSNYVDLDRNTGGWQTVTVSVPADAQFARLRLMAKQNGNGDYAGFDNVRLAGSDEDTVAPFVVSAEVLNDFVIQVVFSEPMDPIGTLDFGRYSSSFFLSSLDISKVDTLFIEASSPFENGVQQTLTLLASLTDEAGNPLESDYTFEFIYNDATPNLVITEIMYNPPTPFDDDDAEFIEVYNAGDTEAPVGGMQLSVEERLEFTLPELTVPAGGFVLLALNEEQAETIYGQDFIDWGDTGIRNSSENIRIFNSVGDLIDQVQYDDGSPWPTTADGDGPSLELISLDLDNNEGTSWKASTTPLGETGILATPGAFENVVNPIVSFVESTVAVNEGAGTIQVELSVENTNDELTIAQIGVSEASTAQDGVDYTLSGTMVQFELGGANSQFLNIDIPSNSADLSGKYLLLEIESLTNGEAGTNDELLLLIKDTDDIAPQAPLDPAVQMSHLGSTPVGGGGEGKAEIAAHDPVSQRLFVTNGEENKLEILDFSDPANLSPLLSIDLSVFGSDGINSVAVHEGIVAVAVEGPEVNSNGQVLFFDTLGNLQTSVEVGVLPDMVVFTPDGSKVLTANEGEPDDDYLIDPPGSISIIDLSVGNIELVNQQAVTTLDFTQFDGQEEALRAQGIRLFGPGASASQDLEPEFITVSDDGSAAFVTCQENNAVAVVDLASFQIATLLPIGYKDWSQPGLTMDASNRAPDVFFANWPVNGMYQPDAIDFFTVGGQPFLITANEGDARDYDGFSEEVRVGDAKYVLDPTAFPNADVLKKDELLGRLNVTNATGDTDGDGDFDEIYVYGARSFSIWNAVTGQLVYDSGNDLELITVEDPAFGPIFNSTDDENGFKSRSDDKGPEPEAVVVGEINGTPYAFIGLERIGGVMMYDVSDPAAPQFIQWINTRDPNMDGGDLAPEGLVFVAPEDSPTGHALLTVAYEVSGTIGVFEIEAVEPPVLSFALADTLVEEGSGTINIELTVEETASISGAVTISAAEASTAVAGVDYNLVTSSVFVDPGESDTQTIQLELLDNDVEGGRYLILQIDDDSSVGVGSESEILIMIKDNDDTVPMAPVDPEVILTHLGSTKVGGGGEGRAEILAHDPVSQRVFLTNGEDNRLEILGFNENAELDSITSVDLSPYGDGPNSVAVHNGMVAVAVQAEAVDAPGTVVFFDTTGAFVSEVTVGVLPDMLLFTPDGTKVLTANEGEPNDDYTIDPEGSVSVIDVSGGAAGLTQANVTTITFEAFNEDEAQLVAAGVRIFGPNATVARDLEPEYITVSADGTAAYVNCQENNALVLIDLTTNTAAAILPIGYKDWTAEGVNMDASNRSDDIFFANWPVKGMYQPDAIDYFEVGGQSYLITANEGDARDYDGFSEEARIGDEEVVLDETAFPDAEYLKNDKLLGRLLITTANGDTDGDGDFDELYAYGARSFSIWDATTGALVYDSGNELEQITANDPVFGELFNTTDDENNFKNRSDDKGPEPEAVRVGEINGTPYAFIGLERIGGVMMYDVSDPAAPQFVQYVNTRTIEEVGGDLAPEGLIFIPAGQSPNGRNLVAASYEVSGTLALFEANFSCGPEAVVDTIICMNETFIYDPGDGFRVTVDGVTDTTFTVGPLMPDTYVYDLTVTGPDGCTQSVTLNLTSDNCTSAEEVFADYQIKMFPNPAYGPVVLQMSDLESVDHEIEVLSIAGQQMWRKRFEPLSGTHTEHLDLSQLPAGVYLVKVISAEKTWSRQLIRK